MKTMQQLTFIKPKTFEWHEVTAPKIVSDAAAVVKPLAVTRCDLDLYIANGVYPLPGPFAFGHEIAGEIVDVGDAVDGFKPGDRVIVPFQINCGDCAMCRRGYTNGCTSVPKYSAYGLAPSSGQDWGGGLSDLVYVPYANAMLVKIPESISLIAAAALADNAVDGYRTVASALAERPRAPVLVIGGLAQSVSLYAVQHALALGSERVVYHDFHLDRLALAKSLGAETVQTDLRSFPQVNELFPIVVEGGGTPEALTFALKSTEACGLCTGVSAGLETSVEIPLRSMYMKGVRYEVSRVHARAAIHDRLNCPSCSAVNAEKIINTRVSFSDAIDAMCEPDIKIVFEWI